MLKKRLALFMAILIVFVCIPANKIHAAAISSLPSGYAMVSGSVSHAVALKKDGTVWCWGSNKDGELGDGTTTDKKKPVQVSGLKGCIAVCAGAYHTIALKSDGTVWAWGYNYFGQLGDGTKVSKSKPVQVNGLKSVKAISSNQHSVVVVKSDGTVWCWGRNDFGQLGDGTTTDRTRPVLVKGISNITSVSSGGGHTLALQKNGTVFSWGDNAKGQLGDATANLRSKPAVVAGLSSVKMISAGEACVLNFSAGAAQLKSAGYSTVLKNDGTVWCWGSNSFGQLGNGTNESVKKPAQVPELGNVSAISTAGQHMAALKKDGTVWCWGDNWSNELGDGTRNNSNKPVQAKDLSGITYAAACGGCTARYLDDGAEVSAASYTLVIKKDGTMWGWGNNEKGQLGDGSNVDRQKPVQVAISGGSKLSLPLPKTAQVKKDIPGSAKGQDTSQVKKDIPGPAKGQDTSKDESDKKPLSANLIHDGADAIAAGFATTIVIKTDGTVSAWGKNNTKGCDVPAGLSGVKAIAGGFGHTVALKKDGTVVEWGMLIYGMPSGLTGIKAIAAGEENTVALRKNGTVIAWGQNDHGQCNVPKGLKGVQAITAGVLHTVALKEDGTVAAWGYNASGQCKVPKGLNGVKAVAAGKDHTAALKEDGTVIVWGSNKKGQCNVPKGLKGVTAISAGYDFTTALKADGTVVLWGNAGDNRFNVPYGLKGVTAIAAGWFHVVVLKEDGTVVAWGNCTDGECNVPVGAFQTNVFKVSFNRPVDMAKASFAITGESVPVGLGGPIQWSESGKAAYLKTAGSLADGEYKVTVAGLSSTPLIASCIINNPMSITVAAAQPNTLSVKFNKAVNAASFTVSTSANPKNTIVPNSVAWSADKKTVNLGLPGTLEANMTYVVTVTGLTSGPISASVLTNAEISTGYVAGYEIGMNQGSKYIKLDNSNCNADIVVKIININGSSRSAIRVFNVKKGDSFVANNIPEGTFLIRYKLLNTGSVQETAEFTMGSQHSGVTIIINPVKDANLNTNRIPSSQF